MKDQYSETTDRSYNSEEQQENREEASLEEAPKGPSPKTVRKILDYSKAYEAIPRKEGSDRFVEFIRN